MPLYRTVYVSDLTGAFPSEELRQLVQHSHEKNTAQDITGLLLFTGTNFLQVLEGEQVRVARTYNNIARDQRHQCLHRIVNEPASFRLFPDWGMQLVDGRRLPPMTRTMLHQTVMNLRLLLDGQDASDAIQVLQEFRSQLAAEAA